MATDEVQNALILALKELIGLGRTSLENVEKDVAKGGSWEDIVDKKIRPLFGLMSAGAKFFNSLGVKNQKEAESLWEQFFQNTEIRDNVEALLQLEVEWDSFLKRLDVQIQMSDTVLSQRPAVQTLSSDTRFIHVQTKENVSLDQYLKKGENLLLKLLDAQSLRVLVVSCGSLEGAMFWLDQTGYGFDMLLDAERAVYQAFSLGSSISKVMKFKLMLHYSEILVNRKLPEVPPQFIGDLFQMGGDFVVDQDGKVIFSYRCKSPVDRPSVTQILAAVSAHS
ncbi:hypothetical protein Q8A67_017336 [Cirrhinus molitorella]|uniref:Uncharacterized protein n=1 Tax=Cirrhinus molitorella TaxID=172907 RepID=A0AA88PG28_9TELE|nr:hypothetical protein Q8A67_017336 [Cirrhinus molitorella]